MRAEYDAPKEYVWGIPMFDEEGRITERVRTGTENVLAAYTDIAHLAARYADNNPENYCISAIVVVGSGAARNRVDSDMDLLLIAPNLDPESCRTAKMILSSVYFNDRPKEEAIDVFVRRQDEYPDRPSVDVTEQIRDLLDIYNKKLHKQQS